MTSYCAKCHKSLEGRPYQIKCFKCGSTYDLQCANVSEKRFDLIRFGNKNWTCNACHDSGKHNISPDYVTVRRNKMTRSCDDLSSLSIENNDSYNLANSTLLEHTLPNLDSQTNGFLVEDLQQQITKLKEDMLGADHEISKLLGENSELEKQNLELRKKNEMYKKLLQGQVNLSQANIIQKRASILSPSSTLNKTPVRDKSPVIDNLNKTIKVLQDQSKCAIKEIEHLKQHIEVLESKIKNYDSRQNRVSGVLTEKKNNGGKRANLFIVSSNNRNKIRQIANSTFSENFAIYHHLTPHAKTENMLENLATRVCTLTKEDYCVIFVGEEDFLISKSYYSLVKSIRETLAIIKNTNVIICAPTFKYSNSSSIFNGRIETFNNILCKDNLEYEYAFLLDSNLNLSYDNTMFRRYGGTINNYGMKTIMDDLKYLISDINYFKNLESNSNRVATINSDQGMTRNNVTSESVSDVDQSLQGESNKKFFRE